MRVTVSGTLVSGNTAVKATRRILLQAHTPLVLGDYLVCRIIAHLASSTPGWRFRCLPGFEVYRFGKGNRNVTSAAALRLFSGNFKLTSCCSRMVSQDGFRGDGPSCPQVPPVDGYVTKQQ